MESPIKRIVEDNWIYELDNVQSSSHVQYQTQEEEWTEVAQKNGLTLDELAQRMAEEMKEPFPGVEGLYELTQNKNLWPLTDYAHAANLDQLCVSYFYTGPERLKHWVKNVNPTIEMIMSSTAFLISEQHGESNVTVEGTTIRFPSNYRPDTWDLNDVLNGLRKAGLDIEETTVGDDGQFTQWTCHGKNLRKAILRIIA